MKKLIALFVLMAVAAYAQDDYRTFTAADGRTLEAKIISYDSASGKTMIERKDRRRITVEATVFSEKDQSYLKKWVVAQTFLSPDKLKLDLKRDEVKSTKKDIEVDLSEVFPGRRGASGIQVVAVDKRTQYRFDLLLENKSKTPLKNLTVEYRIYYEQEKAVEDEKANKGRPEDDPRPKRHMPASENKVKEGSFRIREINPGESLTKATESVNLLKRSANRQWGENIDLKYDLHGVWIKLAVKGADGKQIYREIAYPPSIPKKFPWDADETTNPH